jgi:hypothetical protein
MGDNVETQVATAVTEAVAKVADKQGSEASEEKLDAKTELFLRRLTDSVTKSIADLILPDDDTEDEDAEPRKPRKLS